MDHTHEQWLKDQAQISLKRLLPRLLDGIADHDRKILEQRLNNYFSTAFKSLYQIYGHQYDFFYHLESILKTAISAYTSRSVGLKQLDQQRESDPHWFQSEQMMGAVCYVDLFANDLEGLEARIPYLEELGVTYLHLMPLFKSPEKNNDGGYAVSDFRQINPALGTMQQFAALTEKMRAHGISVVVDFVFNHTSDEHPWAQGALRGEREYQAYYRMFDDRSMPDAYEPQLREIFPEQAPGSFTYRSEIGKWVWTTFYNFQWDLNYANPELFRAMLDEMLFLANQGVEVLRLDAVPFIWKELGTNCENLPQVNILIQAYNALTKIACPALLFKSEAIVHPRDVRSYIGQDKCPLSYNPIMMVSIWEALATREVYFFTHTMRKQFALDEHSAWLNYVRSHDDIGWGFADEDAWEVGISGYDHRRFLNSFYTGTFPGSFAKGLPFNYNPRNGDMRISGTCASLAGLEQGLESQDELLAEHAIRRILLIYGICLSAGGIPLLYLGDELGTLNHYAYKDDMNKAADSRWVHRPPANATLTAERNAAESIPGRIYQPLKRMIQLRKSTPALRNGNTQFIHTSNTHVLAFTRHDQILVLANFSERPQSIDIRSFSAYFSNGRDLLQGHALSAPNGHFTLEPYQLLWIKRQD